MDLVRLHVGLSESSKTALNVTLAELLQNVIDHADSPVGGLVSARAFSHEKEVRIAVADFGVGFRESLSRVLQVDDDLEALRRAAEQPISGRNSTHNRGVGLKLLREIVEANGGTLAIASETAYVEYTPRGTRRRRLPYALPGTVAVVRLKIKESAGDVDDVDVWDE